LANVDATKRERVALDVYVVRESADEISAKLAEAQEELVSAEVAGNRFEYSVEPLARLEDLHGLLNQSDRSPHVLCLFDPAEVAQNATPIANLTPVLGALVNEWEFGTRASREATPFIRPRTGSSALNEFLTAQARLLGIDSVGATQRTPLLPAGVLTMLATVAPDTSWVVVAQGASALVAPPSIGAAELLGRASSGSHTAYVYSETPALVLEPVLAYLQQYAYLQSDVASLIKFVLGTIRLALPEGLLGFYKRFGSLSAESVLGRLGLAAVVAHLQETAEHPNDLIVSLDTEGARRWLGLRDGVAKRADLVRFVFSGGRCRIEAIEIKTRSGTLAWGASVPEPVAEALEQVDAMHDLLKQIFIDEARDQLTASRREILKRQVFLEALHQWEPLRERHPADYRKQIAGLNELFARSDDSPGMPVELVKRIFAATPGDDGAATSGVSHRVVDGVGVTQLGLDWFRNLLVQQPGGSVQLDAGLLDLLDLTFDGEAAVSEPAPEPEPIPTPVDDLGARVLSLTGGALEPDPLAATTAGGDETTAIVSIPDGSGEAEDTIDLLKRLQASFRARNVPYISVSSDEVIVGPSVIQVPIRLELGSRTAQLENQADDIARDLGVHSFRTTNLPGKPGYVLAEVPRARREIPDVESLDRPDFPYPALAVGAGLDFMPFWQCLDDFPHLLIAGKTGSGKSVLIRSLLWQLTRLYRPKELDLVLIGPKAADYMDFVGAPHFRSPSDVHLRADGAIDLLREIVEVRYPAQQATFDAYARAAMHEGVRISNLRELMAHAAAMGEASPLRPFVVIVDEFVELLDSSPSARREFEALIARFSRLFRYIVGTMIAATQRPSVKSITGDIKANFRPLALRVERSVDSRVILDENGAEQLIGQGDSLYKADSGLVRLQGYSALGTYLST
jgi:S-DNA-T family DNA segregation ATPase FtsK/SpoIIIE